MPSRKHQIRIRTLGEHPIDHSNNPEDRSRTANATKCASTVHCKLATLAPKAMPICERAMLRIEPSSWTTKNPRLVQATVMANHALAGEMSIVGSAMLIEPSCSASHCAEQQI